VPKTLDFLGTTWKPLQSLKRNDPAKYELVLGSSVSSLWKTRNAIAHAGKVMPVGKYKYINAALWAITELQKEAPTLERLREKNAVAMRS